MAILLEKVGKRRRDLRMHFLTQICVETTSLMTRLHCNKVW